MAPTDSIASWLGQPDRASVAYVRGAPGTGKSILATRTLLDVPGSLYLAFDEPGGRVFRRMELSHKRFGGTPFEVREVSSLAQFRAEAFEWTTGVVCVDSLAAFKPAEVSRILRGHRMYGRRALLATDGVRGALASMEISQQADIVVLVRDSIAFELKNRFEVGAPRVCPINLGGDHG